MSGARLDAANMSGSSARNVSKTGAGRVLGVTLGHDGSAHEHSAFQKLLESAITWLEQR